MSHISGKTGKRLFLSLSRLTYTCNTISETNCLIVEIQDHCLLVVILPKKTMCSICEFLFKRDKGGNIHNADCQPFQREEVSRMYARGTTIFSVKHVFYICM